MIQISNAQVGELGARLFEDFVVRTVAHLRTRFPAETEALDTAALEALVRTAHRRGKTHGVTSAYDVERLSECLLLHGEDFGANDATCWARGILARDNLTGRQKMTAIADYEAFVLRPGR